MKKDIKKGDDKKINKLKFVRVKLSVLITIIFCYVHVDMFKEC